MFPKKTVIVVGAGASTEAGFPSSTELKRQIAALLDIRFGDFDHPINGDLEIIRALDKIQQTDPNASDIDPYIQTRLDIRDALPQAMSIDSFIDAHRGDKKIECCGKLAIVRSILRAEKRSRLYINPDNSFNKLNFRSIEDTWFNAFWQLLCEGCQAEELQERLSSIVLMIFNYDRCIEHFLYHSIRNYYGLSDDRAAYLVSVIKIFHPYGTVGTLPWSLHQHQVWPLHQHPVPFRDEPAALDLVRLAGQIKTFTEGTDPEASDVKTVSRQSI